MIKMEKKGRAQSLKNFTRAVNSFNDVVENDVPFDLMTSAFEKVKLCFGKLETAQDAYALVAVDEDEDVDYLKEPADRYQRVMVTYGGLKKQSIVDERNFQQKQLEDNQKAEEARRKKIMEEEKAAALVKAQNKNNESTSNTKKEAVTLPSFQGDLSSSPSPFLAYPVWLNRWNTLIAEYDEKWRIHFLLDRIDDAARLKIVGCEQDYVGAMKRLESFYGDPLKIISCVMAEVNDPSIICEGDYQGLVSYCSILENNYNRLKNMNLDHEMSNTSSMSMILRKFPNSVTEKWAEFIVQQDSAVKTKPFPTFVLWLISQKKIWEHVAAVETTREESVKSSSHFTGAAKRSEDTRNSGVTCFKCGETGHKRKDCNKMRNKDGSGDNKKKKRPRFKKYWCALHKDDASKNCSSVSCQDLRKMDPPRRIQLLTDNKDCVHCLGDHDSVNCDRKERICGGGKVDRGCSQKHAGHELFCLPAKVFSVHATYSQQDQHSVEGVLLLIANVSGCRRNEMATVFWDLGSTSNFVREAYAKKMQFKSRQERLCVTTLTGTVTNYTVMTYSCSIRDSCNQLYEFEAYGLECITGQLTNVSSGVIKKLFPNITESHIHSLVRGTTVDYLIGAMHPSWHPNSVQRSKKGGDIWLYEGKFGPCIGGRHPEIQEEKQRSNQYFTVNYVHHAEVKIRDSVPHAFEYCPQRVSPYLHKGGFCENRIVGKPVCSFTSIVDEGKDVDEKQKLTPVVSPVEESDVSSFVQFAEDVSRMPDSYIPSSDVSSLSYTADARCHASKTSVIHAEEQFYRAEAMGTMVNPECGSCKCGKCPVPGSRYCLKEQQDRDEFNRNLKYNAAERRYYTVYPWLVSRSTLPKNDRIAYQCLLSLERKLSQDPNLAEEFCSQVEDMLKRGVAIVLTDDDVASWKGDYYFLPMIAVKSKKSLRVCFDASRRQGGYPSLNDCLRKGPDRFMNDLLSVQLCFRNGRVGCVADIAKFHNQVYLEDVDVHMQRFLWRSMKANETPTVMAVRVNNFGVTAANCIATLGLYRSADEHKEVYPIESEEIKTQTYIDDDLIAANDREHALLKTSRHDEILKHAGMPNKGWTYSGDDVSEISISGESSECVVEKVLGSYWKTDTFRFRVTFVFKVKRGEDIHITSSEQLGNLPVGLITRRSMLSNVHRIFDPMGLLIPLLLQAKLLLRSTWAETDLGWDDPLPEILCSQWLLFLESLLFLEDAAFPRSLWPDEEVTGLPTLIIFTDGAALAFGAVAYIRWRLVSGKFWTRIIMAKGKISPKKIVSIPRMELNGAVLGNRIKNFLLNNTNFKFEKVYHLVDSSTVLGYINKEYGVFHPYVGIRVAEIQTSNTFVDGKLENWAWVKGELNPADWCTKPRSADKVIHESFYHDGPEFLRQEESSWPIKFTYKTEHLEDEVTIGKKLNVFFQSCSVDVIRQLIDRSSVWSLIVRVLCWILRLATSGGDKSCILSSAELLKAKTTVIKHAQKDMAVELLLAKDKGAGRYRKLAPSCDDDGVWRVGSRLRNFVPFTSDNKMPVILPPKNRITLLIMREAHQFAHTGQDGTLCRFHYNGYWTIGAGHLARSIKKQCVPCRKLDKVTLSQAMGNIPEERFLDLKPWGYCQIDLLGPFTCRSDVNARVSKKIWAIIVEDVNSGAVHLDVVSDYSADAVIMAMWRFASIRGWPSVAHSDPGSQLVSASGTLVSWWDEMQNPLKTFAGSEIRGKRSFEWKISPADSPWRQGKVERRIGCVKRLIKLSVGDTRLSPLELQTSLMEVANICNERPLGGLMPREDGSFELITPNQLLMGWSGNSLPDGSAIVDKLPMKSRFRAISHVSTAFWNRWCTLVSPGLVSRQKWHQTSKNINVGDLVMIADSGKIKGRYKLGIVVSTNVSGDGLVRSATIQYFVRKGVEEKWRAEQVTRSVQRLVLILSVDEQSDRLIVKEELSRVQVLKET